ncbi:alpha/beta-hydrolase [Trametes versicolor FP-101664 SS1]|uniref:alpha/beta-hydrolase n=1 Tax=Trametes versicolor (strain FP-101664) TaxID=717944 RepID=UPI000462143D|nr:alpha/beta-hydrolase [Trametes versicolor FP-101664 SS1]EIW63762.1 alpha/beta-hydrolase [Trametes versicolor FP-101664 SS1]
MATLAGSVGAHCLQTVQHVGDPRGTVEQIAGVNTYVARPASGGSDKIILFFADVFGALYVNSKLLMDYWAEHGYLVLALDYFEGDSYGFHLDEKGFDTQAWIKKNQARTEVLLPPWIDAVREQYGPDKKYVCVGYCYGAPYVMDHVKKDWITAGAFAHPAFLSEDHFKDVKKPLLLSCAEIDHTFPAESRRRAEDLLVEQKATYFIQVFGSVKHGFALRGDPKVPVEKWAKEESARGILNWFDHFCG